MQPQFMSDMVGWVESGNIGTRAVYEGLDKALDAFLALFSGDNFGKMIVNLSRNSQPAEMLLMRQPYPVDANSTIRY